MALIRWKPITEVWDPFGNLTEVRAEMNRLLDPALRAHGGMAAGAFAPALDVVEEKDNFLVKADLPGLSKEDVSVSIQDNYLTLKGERKHEVEQKESNFYHQERVYGQFVRTVELPARVEASKVTANFKDGVLQVTLPKSEEAKPKEIKVSVN